MYLNGLGVTEDTSRAAELYKLSADQGFVEGQSNLATMYELGTGVTKEFNKVLEFYLLAAEQGDEYANERLVYQTLTWIHVKYKCSQGKRYSL